MGRNKTDKQTFLNIPSHILQDKDLNPTDKLVAAEIDYLDKLGATPGCWEKNTEMAKFLGVCDDTITNSIKRLHALGRIRYAKIDNHRYMYSNYSRKISDSETLKISDIKQEDIRVEQSSRKVSERKISEPIVGRYQSPSRMVSESESEDTVSIDHKDHIRSEKDNNTVVEKKSTTNTTKTESNKNPGKDMKKQKKSFDKESIMHQMAMYFYASILIMEPNAYPSFTGNPEKEEETLQKWAIEFDTLLTSKKHDLKEVEQIISFVHKTKYWPRAKYSAGYFQQNYLAIRNTWKEGVQNSPKQDELPHDPDPELTELVIETYRKVYRPRGEFPNMTAIKHFRLISTKAKKTYKLDSSSSKKIFVEEFFQIAHDTWSSKGEEVMPWDLSGTMMWDYKIPQYYQNMGVPEALIGEVNGG